MVNPALSREDLVERIEKAEDRLEWAYKRIDTLTAQLNSAHDQISRLMHPHREIPDPDPPF